MSARTRWLGICVAVASVGAACTTTPAGPSGPIEVGGPETGGGGRAEVSEGAKRRFDEAVALYEQQRKAGAPDWEKLTGKFAQALEADGDLGEAHYNLGVLAEKRGKPDEAVAHYKRAISTKPSLTAAYENLAVMMENAGRGDEAAEQYKKILERYPDDAGARARLASLVREGGDAERALELARESLLRDPKNLTAMKVQLRVHLDKGDLQLARLVALRASALDANDPELAFALGQILEKEGELLAAQAQYKKTLALRADYGPARGKLIEMAVGSRNWPVAERELRKLLESRPKDPDLHYSLGVVLRAQGKLDEALAAYEKALAIDPEKVAPVFATGVILHKYKDAPDKALEYYERFTRHPTSSIPSDHPVFGYIQECRALIEAKKEGEIAAKQAEEEAKVADAKAKADAAAAEVAAKAEAEAKRKEAAAKALEEAAKAGAADPNATLGGDAAKSPGAPTPAPPPVAAPAPEEKKPAPPERPAPSPPKPAKDADEPAEEPG